MPSFPEFLAALLGLAVVTGACLTARGAEAVEKTTPLASLDLTKMTTGWREAQRDVSIERRPLSVGGRAFAGGVGTHADSVIWIELDGGAGRFSAQVGVDDGVAAGRGSVEFYVYADDAELFASGVMRGGDAAKAIDVDVTGRRHLALIVTSGGDGAQYDHADWAEATFRHAGAAPVAATRTPEPMEILTPTPGPAPRIRAASVYGCRPGRPFLYRIPAQGERNGASPMRFAADGLPATLTLDATTGIIAGTSPAVAGRHVVTLRATNGHGADERTFEIVVGDEIALTPPMGWNHWYAWYSQISAEKVQAAGDVMIASGMADVGYSYVNIDDCWMRMSPEFHEKRLAARGEKSAIADAVGPTRDAEGRILTNARFPDMMALTDGLHARGLKAGIYTSPGPRTCESFEGSFQHEAIDARTFAEWGFDFVKYDWCTYGTVAGGKGLEIAKKPYALMGKLLRDLPRDVIFNLCQYGMEDVWNWGAAVGGQCWRTTGDLGLERNSALPGFYSIGLNNAKHWQNAGPGAWNDPDYILIGRVGVPFDQSAEPRPTTLTANEQYSYLSMWSLMAAPLVFSGDMAHLDAFTLNVLCNAEVIEANQDRLGKQAEPAARDSRRLIFRKPMADGSVVVGLFNLFEVPIEISATWAELGLTGPQRARDLWRQTDLPNVDGRIAATLPRHGVQLIRLWPAPRQ